MLYIYDKQNKSLVPCKETDFRSHGLLERHDLAKWVEQNPTILGEELLIISSEYDRFDKTHERLDLLGLDKDGNLVVIELKCRNPLVPWGQALDIWISISSSRILFANRFSSSSIVRVENLGTSYIDPVKRGKQKILSFIKTTG